VEVFDSVLVFLFTLIFGIFIGKSLLSKHKTLPLVFSYLFFLVFGLASSVAMGEYNIQTLVLSQALFFVIVFIFWRCSHLKKKYVLPIQRNGFKAMIVLSCIIGIYLLILVVGKLHYMPFTGASFTELEPLEQFEFNYNAHTFEIDQGDHYRIGLVSLKGIEEEGTVPKVINEAEVGQALIDQYLAAYPYALRINWFNNPVWTFKKDEDGNVYANIRYAKSFLENPNMPGPVHGMKVKLKDEMLVSFGNHWV